jgi:hypothetical protein
MTDVGSQGTVALLRMFRSLRPVGLGVGLSDLRAASPPRGVHCIDRFHLGPLSRLQHAPALARPAGGLHHAVPLRARPEPGPRGTPFDRGYATVETQ